MCNSIKLFLMHKMAHVSLLTKILTVVFAITISVAMPFAWATNSKFDKPPANFETFKSKINESLVGFNCNGNNSIGFSAEWNISTEEKNKGRNSNIFTSGNSLASCGRYDTVFDFVYKSNTYQGKIWNSGLSLPDFGGFSTSAIIPSLSLWGNDAPSVGSWVGVVRYAPGLGFIWTESKVRAFNSETLIFAIDPTIPLVEKNALVFNNKGVFLGIVSKLAIQAVEGLVLVHGAPLQCPLNKSQTSPSVTDCPDGTFAQNIWVDSNSQQKSTDYEQICVDVITGTGFAKKENLGEECSNSSSWEYRYCSVHPKHELQVFVNKKWKKVKIFTGTKGACSDSVNQYEVVINESKTLKYRVKNYGNSEYQTSYLNVKITSK